MFLLAAELTVLRGDGPPSRRRVDIPGFALLGAVAVASFALRWAAAGTPAFAVVPAADLRSLGLGGRMALMLHVVPMWARLLVWPQHLQVDFAPGEIASGGTLEAVFGAAILCALFAALVYALRHAPVLAFGLLWLMIALFPVSNLVPTGIALAERTLFVPSIGFVLALGAVGERALASARLSRRPTRVALSLGCALLVVLGLLRSAGRHAVWNTQHLKVVPRAPTQRGALLPVCPPPSAGDYSQHACPSDKERAPLRLS